MYGKLIHANSQLGATKCNDVAFSALQGKQAVLLRKKEAIQPTTSQQLRRKTPHLKLENIQSFKQRLDMGITSRTPVCMTLWLGD